MKISRRHKVENMRRIIAALEVGPMGPADVMRLLQISDRAARYYLDELELAGVGTFHVHGGRRLHLKADSDVVRQFLATLTETGRTRICCHVTRDPLVSALFGAG